MSEQQKSKDSTGPLKPVPVEGSLPFPDLTGLRASAYERVTNSKEVYVTLNAPVNLSDLHNTAQKYSRDEDCHAKDVVALAWTIVLILLLAHEDDCHIAFAHTADRDEIASIISFNIDTTRQSEIDICSLLHALHNATSTSAADDEEAPQIALVTEFEGNPAKEWKSKALVSLVASLGKGNQLCLALRASSKVHTTESAQFLLEQTASCLVSLVRHSEDEAPTKAPALSRRWFELHHSAGDNTLPKPLITDIGPGGIEVERFEDQMTRMAQKQPDAIALDFRENVKAAAGDAKAGNIQLTYKELIHMAEIIGSDLQQQVGLSKDRGVVALCLEKSHWTYVAILGVLKAGMTWCPIDTDWPAARREALLAKSKAKVVLTAGDHVYTGLEEVLPQGMKVIRLDHVDMKAAPSSTLSAWRSEASSQDLAYLIWTSGTTGLPKAVGIQHTAAVQALRALQDVIPHQGSNIRYLQFSAYNFDLMILDVFYTWGLGGTLCSSSRSVLLSSLVDIANALKVSHTLLTPAVMAMTPRESIPSLEVVINGGEKLSQVVADTWSVNCCLLNLYGPAEATLIAMNRRVPEKDVIKAPNIGVALPTTSCHALNPRNDIVIKGAVGELVIGGHQCAKGYIGDPDKTQEKFIEHHELGRIYKTGDLVRQLWNGDFEYLGRSDDQVKINGIRIELLEINAAIRNAHAEVKDSETLVMPVEGGAEGSDVQIVNFSVLPSQQSIQDDELLRSDDDALGVARHLIAQARSNLPTYMVPAVFVIVSHFPKTSSAKIDREALKRGLKSFSIIDWQNRLADGDEGEEEDSETIDTELEKVISTEVALICRIEQEKVGRRTPLPNLGLDSIRAITLARKLNNAGVTVSVVDIVQSGTVATIANRYRESTSATQTRITKSRQTLIDFGKRLQEPITLFLNDARARCHIEKIVPATPLQEGLIAETMQDQSRYWLTRVYALSDSVDERRLETALQRLVERHEIMRTIFVAISSLSQSKDSSVFGSKIAQVVIDNPIALCHRVDLKEKSETSAEQTAQEAQKVLCNQILDVKPAIAFAIRKGSPTHLVMRIHHALYDNIALGYLERDLACIYAGSMDHKYKSFSSGLPYILPITPEEVNDRISTWRHLLDGFPHNQNMALPNLTGCSTSGAQSQVETYSRDTSILYADLCHAALSIGTSARPLAQAALASIVGRICDTEHVMIGDSISGRAVSSELDQVMGPVLSTLPVPVFLGNGGTYASISKRLSQFQQDALPVAHISLSQIRRVLELSTTMPLFHIVFVFEPPADADDEVDKDKAGDLFKSFGDFGISVEHDLAFELSVRDNGFIRLGLNARCEAISKGMAEIVLSQYETSLRQAMDRPGDSPNALRNAHHGQDLLSISTERSNTDMRDASQGFVLEKFREHVFKMPDSIAVEFSASLDRQGKESLTYSQLDLASDGLARLISKLSKANEAVAVTLDRSLDTYIALLAILKAGRVYLPVDITIPDDRKWAIARDASVSLLLCHSHTDWSKQDQQRDSMPTVCLDKKYESGDAAIKLCDPQPSDPAYILYTSGSTGRPKGCKLSHRNLSAAIEAFRRAFVDESSDTFAKGVRFLARSIESFDVALLESLLPLIIGGTIVTAPRQELLSNLGKAMHSLKVTHAAVVPSLFFRGGQPVLPSDLPSLRALIVGGERVTQDIIDAWAGSDVPLLNAYGPTEATIGTSTARMQPQDSTGSIGKAFPGTQYLVIKELADRSLRLALRGEAGELCIAGLQLGSYIGEDEKAAFTSFNGTRIYRTGDEVRMLADESIQYLGRIGGDTQVKIRGVRTELGEVDSVLLEGAKEARFIVTRLVKDRDGREPQIVTFVSSASSDSIGERGIESAQSKSMIDEAKALHQVARRKLPLRMAPSHIIPLESLPLAPLSGKVDGQSLVHWFSAQEMEHLARFSAINVSDTSSREPSEIEVMIIEEIKRIARPDQVLTPSTDLFALGLDSLTLLSLAGALAKKNMHVDVGRMMAMPTVEGTAAAARKTDEFVSQPASAPLWDERALCGAVKSLLGRDVVKAYPALPLQAAMIAETVNAKEDGQSDALPYVNIAEFILPEDMSGQLEALYDHIDAVFGQHDIYRTTFALVDGDYIQAISPSVLDLRIADSVGTQWASRAGSDILHSLETKTPLRYTLSLHNDRVYFKVAMHHALYDGVSLDLLLKEIVDQWRSTEGERVRKAGSFEDVVRSVHSVPEEERVEYWAKALQDMTLTPFPRLTGKSIPHTTQVPKMIERTSSSSLHALQSNAKKSSVTVAMLALSSFAELYGKYVGEDEVTFGLVLSGRDASSERIHGPCVNTVPCRLNLAAEKRLEKTREIYAAAQQYQHVPLTALKRRLGVNEPLFNSLFSFLSSSAQSTPSEIKEISGDMITGYPFALELQPEGPSDKLRLALVFDPSHIPEAQADLFLQQFDALLRDDAKEETLSMMSVENLNTSSQEIESFIHRFSSNVLHRPAETAFVFAKTFEDGIDNVTYSGLDKESDRIAATLSSIAGSIVGVHLRQCREIYALLIGLWKANKTYLPLDPTLPIDRLQYIVDVAKPSVVVTVSDHHETAHKLGCSVVLFSELLEGDATHQKELLSFSAPERLDQTAYIMFTSGSTGRPKGVQISHRALGAAILSWSKILPHRASKSRILQLASPGFDVFLIEVCMPLALGFSFATAPKEILLDDLETTFKKLELTMADLPAALASTVEPSQLPKLEWLMSGGDQIDQRVVEQWSSTGLVNAWGPTEATIGNTLGFVTPDSSRSWIGHPYPTSSIFVLDPETHNILPRGCSGELAVGGPQLADGYVGNQELTDERFIHISVPQHNGKQKVYCTGDKGRLLFDGSVEILGRIEGDGQVKINSQRVELKEIELSIVKEETVEDAVVLYTDHPELPSKQLIAFLVTKSDRNSTKEECLVRHDEDSKSLASSIRSRLQGSLPAYMVPQRIFVLRSRSLPLTPNDKKDTKALKAIFQKMSGKDLRSSESTKEDGQDDGDVPLSGTEAGIRKVVARFVGVPEEEIGKSTSLHRLGIDSISGFRLVRMLKGNGYPSLTVRTLLRAPTIAMLARSMDDNGADSKGPSVVSQWQESVNSTIDPGSFRLSASDEVIILPCTPLQQGLLVEGIASEGKLYVHHHTFDIKTSDVERVVQAFSQSVKRHDILRTSFHLEDGDFVQAVHSDAQLRVDRQDIAMSDVNDKLSGIMAQNYFGKEDELKRPPVKLVVLTSNESSSIDFVIHHALYDGETLSLLFEEISSAVRDASGKLDEPVQFRSILDCLIPSKDTDAFWVEKLAGRRDLRFKQKYESRYSFVMQHELTTRTNELVRFAAANDVSIHVVALFAYSKLLVHLGEQRDVVFAQLFGLRDAKDGAEKALGPALNTVLTPVSIHESESARDAMRRIQRENDSSRDYRAASLAQVQRLLSKKRNGRPLKFDALFDFQRFNQDDGDAPAILRPRDVKDASQQGDSQYALNVEFVQSKDRLSLIATFGSDKFSRDDAGRILQLFDSILGLIISESKKEATAMPDGVSDLSAFAHESVEISTSNDNAEKPVANGSSRGASSATEQTIVKIVSESSGVASSDIDVEAELSLYGLDSIAAIRLASKLRKVGLRAGVVDILQGKTVAAIASRLEARSGNGEGHRNGVNGLSKDEELHKRAAGELQIKAQWVEAVLPLLPGQAFEMAASSTEPSPDAGVFTFFYRPTLHGSIDEAKIQSAWKHLQTRHASLRTTFVSVPDQSGVEKIHQVVTAKAEDEMLSHVNIHHASTSIKDFIWTSDKLALQKIAPIDCTLKKAPCACAVVKAADGDILLLRMHHSLYDGWSLPILIEDFSQLYSGSSKSTTTVHVDQHVEYSSFVSAEREKNAEKAKRYWQGALRSKPRGLIGRTDESQQAGRSFLFFSQALPSLSRLEKRASAASLGGLPSIVLAAWATKLRTILSQEQVIFGAYQVGRSSAFDGIETLASNCMNVLPVVASNLPGQPSATSVCKQAAAIKEQLDQRSDLDTTTSLVDILRWTENNTAPFNTYLNLLWGSDADQSKDSGNAEHAFEPIVDIMTRDHEELPGQKDTSADAILSQRPAWLGKLPNLRADINIDVQRVASDDAVHIGVQWRTDIWTAEQVKQVVADFCELIHLACGAKRINYS